MNKTPLHYACCRGDCRIVTSLVSKGADPTCLDKGGRTPIDEALDNEYGAGGGAVL